MSNPPVNKIPDLRLVFSLVEIPGTEEVSARVKNDVSEKGVSPADSSVPSGDPSKPFPHRWASSLEVKKALSEAWIREAISTAYMEFVTSHVLPFGDKHRSWQETRFPTNSGRKDIFQASYWVPQFARMEDGEHGKHIAKVISYLEHRATQKPDRKEKDGRFVYRLSDDSKRSLVLTLGEVLTGVTSTTGGKHYQNPHTTMVVARLNMIIQRMQSLADLVTSPPPSNVAQSMTIELLGQDYRRSYTVDQARKFLFDFQSDKTVHRYFNGLPVGLNQMFGPSSKLSLDHPDDEAPGIISAEMVAASNMKGASEPPRATSQPPVSASARTMTIDDPAVVPKTTKKKAPTNKVVEPTEDKPNASSGVTLEARIKLLCEVLERIQKHLIPAAQLKKVETPKVAALKMKLSATMFVGGSAAKGDAKEKQAQIKALKAVKTVKELTAWVEKQNASGAHSPADKAEKVVAALAHSISQLQRLQILAAENVKLLKTQKKNSASYDLASERVGETYLVFRTWVMGSGITTKALETDLAAIEKKHSDPLPVIDEAPSAAPAKKARKKAAKKSPKKASAKKAAKRKVPTKPAKKSAKKPAKKTKK